MRGSSLLIAMLIVSLGWQTASADVLCARHNGALRLRTACRPNETLVDAAALGLQGPSGACAADAVKVGTTCVDKYESSLWTIPVANTALLDKVRAGAATLQDLSDGGAVQVNAGAFADCTAPRIPMEFPQTGNWTEPVYAVSIPGVQPSACVTWFQAVQACALAGKHLLTNEEWQRAAAGTPDPGADNTVGICTIFTDPAPTGSHPACVSSWGAYDMAGNVYEWVADWTNRATGCTNWPSAYGDDVSCYGGTSTGQLPAAIARGGYYGLFSGSYAGIFDIFAVNQPSFAIEGIGFRCGR